MHVAMKDRNGVHTMRIRSFLLGRGSTSKRHVMEWRFRGILAEQSITPVSSGMNR